MSFFIGVDVGTKSVRGCLSNSTKIVKRSTFPISVYNPCPDMYSQSSEEIWKAVGAVVKNVTEDVADKSLIKGIGFDATCSLVLLDEKFHPVPSTIESDAKTNIIMWMDHRAKFETDIINKRKFRVHNYVGGKVFIEMQMPKILWLKRNLPDAFNSVHHFFDLPDFLTFQATGSTSRSLCSLVCKWNYLCDGESFAWDDEFLSSIGLEDLIEDNHSKIGTKVLLPGEECGVLTEEAAKHLGLLPGTPVGTSIIDAHAGGLTLVTSDITSEQNVPGQLALICGTSTCHMIVSKDAKFVSGVWGPYYSAMVPKLWLNEGGQSATGALIEHVIFGHPASKHCPIIDIHDWLEDILGIMKTTSKVENIGYLTKDIHIYPDFHGNRSPLADSSMKGMIAGLTLDDSKENLALCYLAAIQAIAYGTRDIIERLTSSGVDVKKIAMCGGLSNSSIFIQTHADVLGKDIVMPHIKDSVLYGASMLGASASGVFGRKGDLSQAAIAMAGSADVVQSDSQMAEYHEKKYLVFKKMQSDVQAYRTIMDG